jgi:CO/xanthine dehydrogenase FAD-binding subunit
MLAAEPAAARLVAGCTGLTPRSITIDPALRIAVDALALEELHGVEKGGERLRIGAATSLRTLAGMAGAGALAAAARQVGDEVLQRQGTVGGNLAMSGRAPHDLATALVALDGSVEVVGAGGRHQVGADQLCDPGFTFADDQVVVALEVGLPSGSWAYRKLTTNAGGYGVGTVAVHHDPERGPRVVVNPGTGVPSRLTAVEEVVARGGSGEELSAAAARAMAHIEAADDPLASARYRRRALVGTVESTIEEMGGTAR